jgi:hypothetical protein
MYCRLPYVSRGVLPLKTPAPLYICTSIKQYNHLTFGGTPLSNMPDGPHLALGTSRRDLPTDDETKAEAADAKSNPIRL